MQRNAVPQGGIYEAVKVAWFGQRLFLFRALEFWSFGFVSDFDFRISDFLTVFVPRRPALARHARKGYYAPQPGLSSTLPST
jgi:hypothetical protein